MLILSVDIVSIDDLREIYMTYSTIGILAITIHIIINKDVLFKADHSYTLAAHKEYKSFLLSVLVYYITDALWGVFDQANYNTLVFIDTTVYFIAMAFSVLLWTRFVVRYLEENEWFEKLLMGIGNIFFLFQIVVVLVNIFTPIMFWVDGSGNYHAASIRYLAFGVQIMMFLLTSGYTFFVMTKKTDETKVRYRTISLFGIAMTIAIAFQILFPLMSFYAIGYLVGTCLLHSFVIENEMNEYREKLERLLESEQRHEIELGSVRRLAYTDPLTGVKSKQAYKKKKKRMKDRIAKGAVKEFGVALFDLNDLKQINDTKGHDTGDKYIIDACKLICSYFKHSPVYRIGGDEFVAILEGQDYNHYDDIINHFNLHIEESMVFGGVVVASGVGKYDPDTDDCFDSVLQRADKSMYERKDQLKKLEELT